MKFLRILVFCLFFSTVGMAAELQQAASATNEFGRDLYRQLATGDENLCLSPYSIESALAMTLAGAEGQTRSELARVLHLESNIDEIGSSFAALQKSLEELTASSGENPTQSKKSGDPNKPITLAIANRLFAQKDFDFREQFLTFVKTNYGAVAAFHLDQPISVPIGLRHFSAFLRQ
jgi:serpin B